MYVSDTLHRVSKLTGAASDYFTQGSVKVVVGSPPNQAEFNIPKWAICEASEFFEAACSDRWSCGQQGVVKLEEDDPEVFTMFIVSSYNPFPTIEKLTRA